MVTPLISKKMRLMQTKPENNVGNFRDEMLEILKENDSVFVVVCFSLTVYKYTCLLCSHTKLNDE